MTGQRNLSRGAAEAVDVKIVLACGVAAAQVPGTNCYSISMREAGVGALEHAAVVQAQPFVAIGVDACGVNRRRGAVQQEGGKRGDEGEDCSGAPPIEHD